MLKFSGLTEKQVEESRSIHGSNQLTEQQASTFWTKLADNLKDPMIIILIVALGLILILSFFHYAEWYEGVGIAVAVALATFVSTYSEFKNEESFQKLQAEASRIYLNVFRDGELRQIRIDEIVVGDYVFLQPGDKVPADGSLSDGLLKVNQAMLTGEPEAVKKTQGEGNPIDLTDPHMVYRGTIIEDGEGVMHVLTVGDKTHFGQLAMALKAEERPGPLRLKLTELANQIARLGYIGSPLIALAFLFKIIVIDFDADFALYFGQDWQLIFKDVMTALILSVIIIVVIVPEGLPMMIAIVLAQNMRRLLKSKVLVRQLLGIETAGSLNILYSDKTGTITKGHLEAVGFVVVDEQQTDNLLNYKSIEELPDALAPKVHIGIRENTSAIFNPGAHEAHDRILGGNSTDRALLKFVKADQIEYTTGVVKQKSQILFSSSRKYSASLVELEDGSEVSLIKGAAERVMENCNRYFLPDGSETDLTEALRTDITRQMDAKADDGFRIIGLATTTKPVSEDNLPEEMTLLGFSLIRDEIREEAGIAIKELHSAGIQVVMLTGDRHGTAVAIARECGLLNGDDGVALTSTELGDMSDDELRNIIPRLRVISRCLPSDKTRLVKVSQSLGLVVGMTGDGVNDSPALSNADVGFALGSGTEVAKEASAIVVLDDNIQSIAHAVHYGRTIYRSVQKFITYQLTVNVSAILLAFIGPFLGFELPLTMIQLLWINLIMDTLAAMAFSGEPPLPEHMMEKPKDRDENIISRQMWPSIIANGLFITAVCIIFLKVPWFEHYFIDRDARPEMNIAFLTAFFTLFVLLNNTNMFNTRVEDGKLFHHLRSNKGFIRVIMLIVGVQVLLTLVGGQMFRTIPLNLNEWALVVALAMLIIPFDLARKAFFRAKPAYE
jgi:calcium-translocating P-type ATPase